MPDLSIEQKLYQLIIARLNGDDINDLAYRKKITGLVHKGIGGFIVFGGARLEIKKFIGSLQASSRIPLFIASDIERGVEQQIKGTTPLPCPMAVAAAINNKSGVERKFLESLLEGMAEEAINVGINMPLIPVMDVNQDPDNPIICTRAFSDDPETVAWFGSLYIKTLERSGLLSCAKHFPGHGDTSVDSHISLPVINKSYNALMETDLSPFKAAIKTGVSSVMIGHLTIPALDSKPASLSKKIITVLLRKKLGFKGLVLTDALNMKALNDVENVFAECLNAGADILLHPADADVAVKQLLKALESKSINLKQIDTALERILKAKSKLTDVEKIPADFQKNRLYSSLITSKSITLVKNRPGTLPLPDNKKIRLIFAGDKQLYKSSLLKKHFKNVLKVDTIKDSQIPIVAIFTSVAAWKGSSGIEDSEKEKIISVLRRTKNSIVISFGSPYVLRNFNEAGALVAAYEATPQAQLAVLKCLKGNINFSGKLPVTLT